jgi:hypothetical protein
MEGERGRIVLILYETARSRLAVSITAILAQTSQSRSKGARKNSWRPRQPFFSFFLSSLETHTLRFEKMGQVVLTRSSLVNREA